MGQALTNILIFSSLIVTLTGCGNGTGKGKSITSTDISGVQTLEEGPISNAERAIATRICYAYQSKASTFRLTPFIGAKYNFRINNTNCSNQQEEYTVTPTLRYDLNNNLEFFEADTSKLYAKVVQTDSTGFISQLCTRIKNNEAISNTTIIDNVLTQIQFFRDNLDAYTIRTFLQDATGSKIQSADTFYVRTQFNISSSEQILGMDERFIRQKICPGVQTAGVPKFSEFNQVFDKIIKP